MSEHDVIVNLINTLKDIINQYKLDPEVLEITEITISKLREEQGK